MSFDYLAKIAAKTVACPGGPSDFEYEKDKMLPCRTILPFPRHFEGSWVDACPGNCKGSARVLDPRFEGLRRRCHEGRGFYLRHGKDCPGYTVIRDLGILLECIKPLNFVFLCGRPRLKWGASIVSDGHYGLSDDCKTPLEAATKAVWEWLEACVRRT